MDMEENTVSGNSLPVDEATDIQGGGEDNKTTSAGTDTSYQEEPSSSVQIYEADNEEICSLLRSILDETVRRNDILNSISEDTDTILGIISPEDTAVLSSETEVPDEQSADDYTETAVQLLEDINVNLSSINDSSRDMYSTVSGNSVYLEDIDDTLSGFTETYTETEAEGQQIDQYGISIQLGSLFACSCIFGILLSRCVFGKMR